jgi:hypothetical protein
LELYKLAVEMADRVSARRTTANGFFLTLHAAVTTAVGFAAPAAIPDDSGATGYAAVVTAAGGVVLAVTWWLLLRSYRDLNRAKFLVINDLEKRFPVAIFAEEWRALGKDEPVQWWRGAYTEQGFVERVVPAVFAALYTAAIAAVVAGP